MVINIKKSLIFVIFLILFFLYIYSCKLGIYFFQNKNYIFGQSLLNLACKLHKPQACFYLGKEYYLGKNLKKNKKKALLYFKKGCLLQDTESCLIYKSYQKTLHEYCSICQETNNSTYCSKCSALKLLLDQ